jgi:hypothetical protein
MFNYPKSTVRVEEPAFGQSLSVEEPALRPALSVEEPASASHGFGGRAGLQAGVKTGNHEGFNRLRKNSRMCGSPWKSGPSGPRKPYEISVGFSPRGERYRA